MDSVKNYRSVMNSPPDFEFMSSVRSSGFAWFKGQANKDEMLFDRDLEPLFKFVVGYEVDTEEGNSLSFHEIMVDNDCKICSLVFCSTFKYNFRVQCSAYFAEEYLLK